MTNQAQSTTYDKPVDGHPGLPECPPTDDELKSVERGQRLARGKAAAQRARLEKAKADLEEERIWARNERRQLRRDVRLAGD